VNNYKHFTRYAISRIFPLIPSIFNKFCPETCPIIGMFCQNSVRKLIMSYFRAQTGTDCFEPRSDEDEKG